MLRHARCFCHLNLSHSQHHTTSDPKAHGPLLLMFACVYIYMCVYIFFSLSAPLSIHPSSYVCMRVCKYVMYACMYVCNYVCMYVCRQACKITYIYIYVHIVHVHAYVCMSMYIDLIGRAARAKAYLVRELWPQCQI